MYTLLHYANFQVIQINRNHHKTDNCWSNAFVTGMLTDGSVLTLSANQCSNIQMKVCGHMALNCAKVSEALATNTTSTTFFVGLPD